MLLWWGVVSVGDLLPFSIDAGDGEGPEGDQIGPRDELGGKGGKKLPMPSQQPNKDDPNCDIEHVIGGGERTFGEHREHQKLKGVGGHGQDHSGAKARAG